MSYSDITGHRNMVFDGNRNAAYARAIKNRVSSDSVVMDLGAGLGILGLLAAKHGAAKVYLVEPTLALDVARQVVADNDLNNVECIAATAETLTLNTKVDVLLSVFTGNFLLEEDLLPSLFYARDHFLAPGGSLIPDAGRMEIVPVSAPAYYQQHIDSWGEFPERAQAQGLSPIDYSAVRKYAANTMSYDSADNINAAPLASPRQLMELDFNTATKAQCNCEIVVTIETAGICHGWMGWFQIRLANEWLSTDDQTSKTHWSPVFLPLEHPLELVPGDCVQLKLKRPEGGQWSWATAFGERTQNQSTFLSKPLKPSDLLKQSDLYAPRPSARAMAAKLLLEQIDGKASVVDLANAILSAHPGLFSGSAEAQSFVRDFVEGLS